MRASSRSTRRAYMLIEIVMAGLLVALAMTMTVSLLAGVASQRRAVERRSWALQEAANLMERLNALPFEKLSEEAVGRFAKLSASAEKVLPDGRIEAKVCEEQVGPPMKRIEVVVSWRGKSTLLERPVRLTTWVGRRGMPR